MTFSFEPTRRAATDRVRSQSGDIYTPGELFSNEELTMILRENWIRDFLGVWNEDADGAAGTTAADVEVRDAIGGVQFILERTLAGGPEGEDTKYLSEGLEVDYLYELINWIIGLEDAGVNKGWKAGIDIGGEFSPVQSAFSPSILRDLAADLEIALVRRSWDLAPTGGALPCFGGANAKVLPIYDVEATSAEVLERIKLRKPKQWSDGRVGWTRDSMDARIRELRDAVPIGIPATRW